MPKGLLELSGDLEISQFWPQGGSDADTVNVEVRSPKIRFSASGKERDLQPTRVFEGARVKGQKRPVIHSGTVTIRLQGIDAPELHFQALLRKPKGFPKTEKLKSNGTKYRQILGETATVALAEFIRQRMRGRRCRVLTRIDKPSDAFDKYGRLIGDLLIQTSRGETDVNHWLIENGWVLPSYYNSMQPGEIRKIKRLADRARRRPRGVWRQLTMNTASFDPTLLYRSPTSKPRRIKEAGPVVIPKLFRRRVRHFVSRQNNLPGVGPQFKAFLAKQSDGWVSLAEFLRNPGIPRAPKGNKDLSRLLDAQDVFTAGPGDFVLFEAGATLVDVKGKAISRWP